MNRTLAMLGASMLGIVLCGAASARAEEGAAAASRGFYVGGSVGGSFFEGPSKNSKIFNRSTADSNGDGRADAFTVDTIGDKSNLLWSAFAGYRMADWLGAEVGWTNLGGFTATDTTDPGNALPHNDTVKPVVDGVEARLRAWVPLGTDRVSGIGGVGIFIFQSTSPKACNGADKGACSKLPGHWDRVPAALDPREDSGQALTLSAGLQFRVTDNVLVRTEYQHYFAVLDQGIDTVTASVIVGFYDLFGQGQAGGGMGGITVE